jgi:hypothetical protein
MSTGFQDVLNGQRTAAQEAKALQAAWLVAKRKGETLKKP